MFTAVTNKQLQLQYVMADAKAGRLNAINRVFTLDSTLTYLMCFYHVMTNVYDRLKAVTGSLREQVTADIYDMHFASSENTYGDLVKKALVKWSNDQQLVGFGDYFKKMWITSEFHR
ncbi:unnamed protein product [Phytophthora fragariaefolia]|uniref:Unnamed protein product n=1 Tax=Phytophthora fragariaefolia TaxID=1490495 RepID=A0A9W6YQ20_9STRA|nr:unnamed protein product [Phytophthora fragariaefolia]